MKVTYYGHACFGLNVNGKNLLFDPFIRPNDLAQNINFDTVPADYILISHAHSDHMADAADLAKRTGAMVISNYEITVWLAKAGVDNAHPLNHGGRVALDFGSVKFVNAIHSSSFPDGSYGGNPGGFVVQTSAGTMYYSGDTALTQDMKLVGESVRLRFAALPIGDNFTMGLDDAIRAAEFVQCKEVLGLHYNTYPPIRIDQQDATARFRKAGKTLHLLPIGGSHDFSGAESA